MRMKTIPRTSNPLIKYKEFIYINLAFLDENDFLPIKFGKKIKDVTNAVNNE